MKLPANYTLGSQTCMKRAMDLRVANPALDRWLDLLRTMQENAWPELAKGGKDEEKKLDSFRSEVRQLIASVARSEPSRPRAKWRNCCCWTARSTT